MAGSVIRIRHLWLCNRSDAHIFALIKVLGALHLSLRVMGKFKKRKKTHNTEMNIFFSKRNFRQKIIKRQL